jgi:hypothetical protein
MAVFPEAAQTAGASAPLVAMLALAKNASDCETNRPLAPAPCVAIAVPFMLADEPTPVKPVPR